MAGIGQIIPAIGTSGSITAPSGTVSLTLASALSTVIRDFGAIDAIYLPSLRAIMFAHGTTFQYHAIDGALYLNGPKAPLVAPTVASTAVRATAVLTFSGGSAAAARPSNGETIQVGKPGQVGAGYITFKTTLDTTGATGDQVLIGADIDATITNLTAFINGTGQQGDKWYANRFGSTIDMWQAQNDITVSASTAFSAGSATVTFRAVTYGTGGNSYISVDNTTTGAFGGALFTSGAVGTGTDPGQGRFIYAYAWKRSADGALTALSPTASLQQGTNCNVSLSALADGATRDGLDYIEPFRTLTGDNVYYSGTDVATGGAGTATDSLSDATISGPFHVVTDAGDQTRNYRPVGAGYPPWVRCLSSYKGCTFGGGGVPAAVNTTISGTVALAGTTFTATAGQLTVRMIGRLLRFTSTTDDYVIIDVSESGNTATLNRAAVAAKTGIACTITDARDLFELFWTPPLLLNNWPVGNSLKGVRSSDPAGIIAIVPMPDQQAVFTRTGLWRVYGDPSSRFQVLPVAEGCGAFSPYSVVDAGGTLYWIGPAQAYAWNGQGKPENIGQVENEAKVRGVVETLKRINMEAVDGIVSVFNPSDLYVKWWIPLDGKPYNNFCLTMNTATGTFSLDRSQQAITAAGVVIGSDGKYHTLVGDAYGNVWETDAGYSDGAYGFETVNAITGYTAATLTVTSSGASYPTTGSGLAGVHAMLVTSDGSFYHGKIASNTSTALVFAWPFSVTPTTSDVIIVGSIHMNIETNRFDSGFFDAERTLTSVRVTYSPTTAGRLFVSAAKNGDTATVEPLRSTGNIDYADLSDSKGHHLFNIRRGKGRRCKVGIHDFVPGHDTNIISITPTIPTRSQVWE